MGATLKMNSGEKRKLKRRLWERARGRCWVCERYVPLWDATLDHVNPASNGGRAGNGNLRIACLECNNGRGSQLASEYAMAKGLTPEQVKRIKDREAAFLGQQGLEDGNG